MDDHFSWSDTVYAAFGSCLACFSAKPSSESPSSNGVNEPAHDHISRSIRSDELEGLLADSDDVETLSLHSNPGRAGRRNPKTRTPKSITFFGWSLFGRRNPPIQLPPDDDDEGIIRPSRLRPRGLGTSTGSSSTLDSDAPQLSPSVFDNITPEQLRERALAAEAAEAEERRLKEERRQRRREKRELKRAAQALAVGGNDGEFEGFQGSGSGYPAIPSPFHSRAPTSPSATESATDGYGPFVGATLVPHPDNEDGDDVADLDGGVYTRRAATGGSSGGSDSRSRTSASRSDTSHQYHPISQPPFPHPQLLPPRQERLTLDLTPSSSVKDASRKRTKKSKSSSKSKSSTTSGSQTPSIRSPASSSFPYAHPEVAFNSSELRLDGLEEEELAVEHRSGFPSSGLGVTKRPSNGAMGAFLANTSQP